VSIRSGSMASYVLNFTRAGTKAKKAMPAQARQ
jgi:hypothetical protein